jgi:uroporphyrinogen decarboxylase
MPFEVNAKMDVVEIRKAFPRLQILGGIDKTRLTLDKEAIEQELQAKVTPEMVRHGGYIPHVDHQVPMGISWENFRYYRQRLAEIWRAANNG